VSLLAQIEIASCFRGQPEPLSDELSPLIYIQIQMIRPSDSTKEKKKKKKKKKRELNMYSI